MFCGRNYVINNLEVWNEHDVFKINIFVVQMSVCIKNVKEEILENDID